MTKITKLTASQERRLVEFREEWLQIGLSCDPANFEVGDRVILSFFDKLKKPRPVILHFSSPAMCELAVNFIFQTLGGKHNQLDNQLNSQIDSQLNSQLYNQLYSQLRSQLHSQLRSQLGSQLRNQLYSQLGSQLRNQLDSQLRSQLYSQLRSQLNSQLRSQLYSQLRSQLRSQLSKLKPYFLNNRWGAGHWCAWEAWQLFAIEIGVNQAPENVDLLNEWATISKNIGWWAAWDGIVFVSDRPRSIHFDMERRLHCETGLAVSYSDGWGCHAWHGVSVPSHWIDDRENLDPNEVIKTENVEQRSAGAAICGWPKMLNVLDAKTIDRHENPEVGELIELVLPGLPQPGRFLKAKCPRNGVICEGVPKISDIDGLPIDTAIAAQAWRIGDPQSEFELSPKRT